jgi:RNA polymerase sigma factor for flagellar operon FliA
VDPRKSPVPPVENRVDVTGIEANRERVVAVLKRAMDQLDPQDGMIARMHIVDGHSLADVARALGLEPKPLYRRRDRILRALRGYLEANGVRRSDVQDVLGNEEAG